MSIVISPARDDQDLAAVRELFREYVVWLAVDLSFQNFEAEFAGLPGKYLQPAGELFLATRQDGYPVGCIGVAPSSIPGACEMKRLYVRPAARGTGAGRALAAAAVAFAQTFGYRQMLLDTLRTMSTAIAIYRSLGFKSIPSYYDNPVPDAIFFAKTLTAE